MRQGGAELCLRARCLSGPPTLPYAKGMRRIVCSALLASLLPATAAADNSKLAVLPTQFDETAQGLVPSLFDDYLLTAVQNTGQGYEVIGQEDIGAMLGFEQQRDLLDCSDTSCMADIGGALGVDKIVAVKIARLEQDWIATAKLINIRETRVEARVNEIISGDVKALLESVPILVGKLFGRTPAAGPAAARPAGPPASSSPAAPPSSTSRSEPKPEPKPDPNQGQGLRIAGTILIIGGAVAAGIGGLLMTFANSQFGVGSGLSGSSGLDIGANALMATYGTIGMILGFVAEGVGAKVRVMGAAKGKFGTSQATGTPTAYWLGWVMAGVTVVGVPIFALVGVVDPIINTAIGWGIGGFAGLWFMITGFGEGDAHLTSAPPAVQPAVRFARTGRDQLTPVYGLAVTF